jgi:hypothetical protein
MKNPRVATFLPSGARNYAIHWLDFACLQLIRETERSVIRSPSVGFDRLSG